MPPGGQIAPDKRARVQERHWAHFVSAIRLSKSSPSRTKTPKPAAGLPTEVMNDKGRYRQHPITPFDRHRGSGCPLTPATPPCVRVRTRRFGMVTLVRILQIRETERFEIGRGKRDG